MTTIIETGDAANSSATAYRVAVGDVFLGTELRGGADWVAVTLLAGHRYSFGSVGMGAAGSGVTDPMLKLYAASGSLLAQDDDGGPGTFAQLSYTPVTSGVYFVEVRALAVGGGTAGYGLAVTEGNLPNYGVEMAAAVLYREGASWADDPLTPVSLTWGVRQSGPAFDANGAAAPFSVLTANQIAATQQALGSYADVAGLTFTQVNAGGTTNNATLLVGAYRSAGDGSGAYAYFPGSSAAGNAAGDLWLNDTYAITGPIPVGSYSAYLLLHELGHALGLSHPGDYDAGSGAAISYQHSAQFIEDSQQYSVMSYFSATTTEAAAPASYCDTLMLYDIYAVQQLYGVNQDTRSGNDTYGFHATQGGAYDFTLNDDPLLCIWDGGGKDTLDLSGFAGRQRINLNDGAFSDVGGYRGNLSIALGAQIENAVGGAGRDVLLGNGAANVLRGGSGADVLKGGHGPDRLSGNAGADRFVFADGFGHDRINDFNKADDLIRFSSDLWGGAQKTAAGVLAEFAVIRGETVVFDFGPEELTLQGVTSTAGLAAAILIF